MGVGRLARMVREDEGSVLLLGIGWLVACLLAAVVVIDASAVFLQRQQLQAAADAAALSGAQAIDFADYYAHGASATTRLEPVAVRARVLTHLERSAASAALPGLHVSKVWTDGSSVHVILTRPLRLPILPGALDVEVPDATVESWARLSYRQPGGLEPVA